MIPVTIKQVDPNKPPFPEINLPKWISPGIRSAVDKHLEFMRTQKNAPIKMREMFDLYAYLVHIFNKVKTVFTDQRMKPIWCKLESISKEETAAFASNLLHRIENDYDGALTLIQKHRDEALASEKVIATAKLLIKEMESYQSWFYSHMLQENHNELTAILYKFIDGTTADLDQFKEHTAEDSYMFCDLWPINRQNKDKNSLPIFYMRKIYIFFMESFGTPMYSNVAEIVNVIFGTEYTENHAVKYCKIVRLPLHDNSKGK
ncbi:MAG TPA: hypothetical protein VFU82_03315 [Gammaproteobacteria bacterium]|nr:hypothetical protein [Gammaproteobacteria bacterium]